MRTWLCEDSMFGARVTYRDGDGGEVSFRPNQFGKVISFSVQGGVCIPLFSIMREIGPLLRGYVAPDRGRYGDKFSPRRRALCQAIATVLNERGIHPTQPRAKMGEAVP